MRIPLLRERILGALLAGVLLFSVGDAHAQDFCSGDVDGDGVVTSADAEALLPVLFTDPLLLDVETLLRADVNDDGSLSGADVLAVLALDGLPCPTPVPTSTIPTPTVTPVVSPTPTSTRPATPTASPPCEVRQIGTGSTNGTLSPTDCQQPFSGQPRLVDVFSIAAAPGTAIQVDLTAAAPLVGYLRILDPAGQFETIENVPPIQFTVTSAKPYRIVVSSRPATATQTGDYTLTLTSTTCPAAVALPIGTSRAASLDGTECPEPALPSVTNEHDPADVFTFTVTDVPKNLSITMQQLSISDDIFPLMSLLGPDGVELVSQDSNFDCTPPTGSLFCSQIRFLALQRGTYTILATGGGGTGRYSMTVAGPMCTPKVLAAIPPDHPLTCAGSAVGCTGMLEGATAHTPCAAPLPDPGLDDIPEPGSPADLYSFTADAGDVISVKMTSDDDPHLYLLGPPPASALVAADYQFGVAQVAATLVVPGTYTIVAANNYALQVDDPPVGYTLLIQKCPLRGGLNPLTGRQVTGSYNTLDCLGAQDIPYRSYAFAGQAGQLVVTTMTSTDVDGFVRVLAPDGSVVENDDDPFQESTDARASRVLPVDGTYFVEVSASQDGPPVDVETPLAFTVRSRLCATTRATPGQLSGTWEDADCDFGAGRKGDVYTFLAGTTPAVATVSPPSNGCILALLGDGTQVPAEGCSTVPIDIPLLGSGVHGLIVAGAETSTRGAYTLDLSRCPASTITVGDTRDGTLNGSNCVDANGISADWYLIQAPARVLTFNFGVTGDVNAGFPLGGLFSDRFGGTPVFRGFGDDAANMFSTGNNLAAVLRITGATAADLGAYDVSVDPPLLRQ